MRLVLIGHPGSGRQAQAQRLSELLQVPQLYIGDMLRAAIAKGSPAGQIARFGAPASSVLDEEVVVTSVIERLAEADVAKGFILDGFPRTICQARRLETELAAMRIELDAVLKLKVSKDAMLEQVIEKARESLSDGLLAEVDEDLDAVQSRFEDSWRKTERVVDYYERAELLHTVTAATHAESVTAELVSALRLSGKLQVSWN